MRARVNAEYKDGEVTVEGEFITGKKAIVYARDFWRNRPDSVIRVWVEYENEDYPDPIWDRGEHR